MSTRVLVVDDEDTLRMVISEVLEDDGYDVTTAASGEEALNLFRQEPYAIVVTDVIMGKMSGLELLQEVKLLDSEALVVVMTSQASLDKATTAIRSGAYDFLTKPFEELDVISAVVNRANEKVQLLKRNRSLMVSLKKHAEELERLNSNLEDMAVHDGLTGLHLNRSCLCLPRREADWEVVVVLVSDKVGIVHGSGCLTMEKAPSVLS